MRKYNGRYLVQYDWEAIHIINTILQEDGILLTELERRYVNYIVQGLKSINVWSKIKALYGFVGGTAATHKWNWKDMRDADDAFRLSFSGGFLHNSNGVKGDGTSSYANTYLNANSLDINSCGIGIYTNSLETSLATTPSDVRSGYTNFNALLLRRTEVTSVIGNSSTTNNVSFIPGLSNSFLGFTLSNKIGNSHVIYNKEVNRLATNQTLSVASSTQGNYYIAGHPTQPYYTTKPYQTILFHNGLTEKEAIQLSNIITTAQKILNRA